MGSQFQKTKSMLWWVKYCFNTFVCLLFVFTQHQSIIIHIIVGVDTSNIHVRFFPLFRALFFAPRGRLRQRRAFAASGVRRIQRIDARCHYRRRPPFRANTISIHICYVHLIFRQPPRTNAAAIAVAAVACFVLATNRENTLLSDQKQISTIGLNQHTLRAHLELHQEVFYSYVYILPGTHCMSTSNIIKPAPFKEQFSLKLARIWHNYRASEI